MSGVAGLSGRRTNVQRAQLRSIMDLEFTVDDWRKMFRRAFEEALKGRRIGAQYLEFLVAHYFGVPAAANNDPVPLEPFHFIEVLDDHPATPES